MHLNFMVLSKTVLTLVVIGNVGCGFSEPRRVENDFGNSVRQMVQEQIHDPATASEPLVNAPDYLDGESADLTIDAIRDGRTTNSSGNSNQ